MQITNEAGYIGIDYIDDRKPAYGYLLNISDVRADGKKAFDLSFRYLLKDGKTDTESLGIEVSWNSAVERYQEFSMNQDPEGFQSEVRNPPHLRLHK